MSFAIHQHWEEAFGSFRDWYRVRDHFALINGYPFKSENFNADGVGKPLVRIRDLLSDNLPTFFDGDEGEDVVVNDGDIVIGMDGDFNSVTWTKGEALLNQRVCALRAKSHSGVESRMLGYQIPISLKIINDLTPWSTVKHLSSLDVLSLRFPKFNLSTQREIADFLDRETARIDLLIEKKQKLVALLGEERGATITSMVTGSEESAHRTHWHSQWFPELPSDWALARVKHVTSKISDGPHISPEYVDEGIPFISARNIKVQRWSLDDAKHISPELFKELTKKSKPQVGDVLYTKGGTTGVARAVDLDFDFHIWVHVALLKLRKRICIPQFLAYALNSAPCYEQSQLATRGATNNDLGLSRIANIQIPLPPLDRQKEIIGKIDRYLSRIDSLTGTIDASIDRLKENRSALITAAVTGQIDVNTYAKSGATDRRLDAIQEEMGA